MKTIEDTKIETAYNYAFNYYKQHGRSLDHQNTCINQMSGLTGFDRATCIEIQNPVQSIMMYNENVELNHTIIQQQLNTVTGIIRSHLLNINHGNVEKNQSSDSSFKTPQVPYVSKTPAYTAQEMVGWLEHTNNTQNLKFNLPYKEINLSGKSVADEDMVFFAQRMSNFAFHLDSLQLNHNPIGDSGIQALFNCAFTVPLGRSVVHLKLNNCNFGDVGAELIAAYVRDGYMPATRSIDVSGNNIAQIGDTKVVQALKAVWQDIAVFTHTLDEIVKISDGSKEEKVAIFRSIIAQGKSVGTYDKAIVVDKSWLGSIKHSIKSYQVGTDTVVGFTKCHLLPEPEKVAESYAQDKIIATLPLKTASGLSFAKKYVGKLLSFHDVVTCFVSSHNDALTSTLGQEVVKHELCLLGEEEFCAE